MKKIIILIVMLAALLTGNLQAQTNIPLTNGDFSSGASTLSGSSPWTSIPGFTITQSGTATSVTAASSGVFAGTPNELKLVGTVTVASAVNTDLIIKTTPVDISTLGNTATLTFAYQMKTASVTATNIPYNIILRLTDINGVDVTAYCTNGAISKVTPGFKTGYTAGTYLNASCGVTLQQNSTAATGGLDASFISLEIQCAKILGNTPSVRSFTLASSAVPATTTVSAPASTALTYVYGAGPSAEQSYTVAGANLTANVVVTPGTNLEISTTSGSGFASAPITLTKDGSGTVATTTIYTRLIAGLAVGTGGSNATRLITVSTATSGVANKTIQFTANVTAPPYTTTVSTPSNPDLTYEAGFGPSAESTFTVAGAGLLTDITVTPGSSLEISTTSGTGFVNSTGSITLTKDGSGTVATTTIYTRLKVGFGPGGTGAAAARTVTIANVEAGNKTVVFTSAQVSGISNAVAGGSTISYVYGAGPSAEKILTVTGASLGAATTVDVTPSSNIEISLTSGSGFVSTAIPITVTAGAITSTPIYARLKAGLAVGDYTNATTKVIASVIGASFTSKEVQFTSTVTTAPTISFALATENKTLGDAAFTQTPTSNSAGAITYSSGSTGVATVDPATGAVTIVGVGSAVITATQAANGYYTSGSTSYTVVVAANVTTAENISTLALPASGSVTVSSTGTLTIDQDASGITINVQPGGKVTLAETKVLTSSTLTLQSDATGTATFVNNGGTITGGTMNFQQYLTAGRNWYISSPVSNATSSVFNPGGSLNAGTGTTKLYWYDEVHASTLPWPLITTNSTTLDPMKGYVVNLAHDSTIVFSGTLNSNTPTINVSRTVGQTGFNLVGNPFPAYLDWDQVSAAASNIGTSIWQRSKSNTGTEDPITHIVSYSYVFDTYNASGKMLLNNSGKGINSHIPPMQAFWVRVNNAASSGSLTLSAVMRSHKGSQTTGTDINSNPIVVNDPIFKSKSDATGSQSVLRLQVSNGINTDETVVYNNSNAMNSYDNYDSPKMFANSASIAEIYTVVDNEQLAINGLNTIPFDTEIPLGFTTATTGTFSLKALQFSNFAVGTQVMLKDNADVNNPVFADLSDGSIYTFTSGVVTNNTSRLSLIFRAPSVTTGINPNSTGNVWISVANNQIVVNGANTESTVAVYNEVGLRLMSQRLTSNTKSVGTFVSGVYFVTVTNAGKTITRKVIID